MGNETLTVLMISTDRALLNPESAVARRHREYSALAKELHIILFSLRREHGTEVISLAPNVHVYPTGSRSKLFYGLDTLRIVRRLVRPDVISSQDPFETGLLALLIARLLGVPLYMQVHTDFLTPGYGRLSLVNRLRMIVARFVLPRAARIRVVSDRVKEEITERYALKTPVSVLPIFVDIQKYQHAPRIPELEARFAAFATKILVVSRLEREKNVRLAIESFAQAAPHDACLIIVGTGSEAGRLKHLAQEKHIAERIFFEGERPAIDYYPLASLLLVTSHYEGYGLVTIEALAAGKPVLSTDVGIARLSGALIASEADFPSALARWFENGPHAMHLAGYPYANRADYIARYGDDIAVCIQNKRPR